MHMVEIQSILDGEWDLSLIASIVLVPYVCRGLAGIFPSCSAGCNSRERVPLNKRKNSAYYSQERPKDQYKHDVSLTYSSQHPKKDNTVSYSISDSEDVPDVPEWVVDKSVMAEACFWEPRERTCKQDNVEPFGMTLDGYFPFSANVSKSEAWKKVVRVEGIFCPVIIFFFRVIMMHFLQPILFFAMLILSFDKLCFSDFIIAVMYSFREIAYFSTIIIYIIDEPAFFLTSSVYSKWSTFIFFFFSPCEYMMSNYARWRTDVFQHGDVNTARERARLHVFNALLGVIIILDAFSIAGLIFLLMQDCMSDLSTTFRSAFISYYAMASISTFITLCSIQEDNTKERKVRTIPQVYYA